MEIAWVYLRISDDDQSHFSLEGQEKVNITFAAKHGMVIEKTFIDDGYSAKDFKRPEWKKLEKELAKNKGRVKYLIVWKYDRLIRNVAEGFPFIEKLENKWNVRLLSAMENLGIDPSSPFFFKHRADALVDAEFERLRISDRTKMGNWSAKESGRYIGKASIGYINTKEQVGKKELPLLVVDEGKKPVIEKVFDSFLQGVSYSTIVKQAAAMGVILKGHEAIQKMVANPVYAGLVKVPSYNGSKAYIKKGIHEPIIPEETYWRAYYKLMELTKPQGPKMIDEQVPLRGYIICKSCGGFLTGGKAKGRSQYYWYYRCMSCHGENYSAIKVHGELSTILSKLSLQQKYIDSLIKESDEQMQIALEENNSKKKSISSELEKCTEKLNSLEEKYISNKLSEETYNKWFPQFSKEVFLKRAELADLNKNIGKEWERYKRLLPYLTDLFELYSKAGVDQKQTLLKGIFWGGFIKEKTGIRTKILNPMFDANLLELNNLLTVETTKKPDKISGFPFCTRSETRTRKP